MHGTFVRQASLDDNPAKARISEVKAAHQRGLLLLTHARILAIVLGLFKPYKNLDWGIRTTEAGDVLTDAMIAEAYERQHGAAVSIDTITKAKKAAGDLFPWWRWTRTGTGCTYRMDPDGLMRGKYPVASHGKNVQANPHACGFQKRVSKEEGLSVEKDNPLSVEKKGLEIGDDEFPPLGFLRLAAPGIEIDDGVIDEAGLEALDARVGPPCGDDVAEALLPPWMIATMSERLQACMARDVLAREYFDVMAKRSITMTVPTGRLSCASLTE
jgi:hypothetical protein